MKKIQHNAQKIQQKQLSEGHPSSNTKGGTGKGVGMNLNRSDALVIQKTIEAVIAHKNWGGCSDVFEAMKVWGEVTEELEMCLRQEGHGEALDEAIQAFEEEEAAYEKGRNL